jgi:dTDP-4-dehydrorhamnose 3,5-epimerase
VPTASGMLVEIFRQDWGLDAAAVAQAFASVLEPGAISAWHVHERSVDRLFALNGIAKVVLYDARRSSPTFGRVNEFLTGSARHTLVSIPPGVWHGVQNLGHQPLTLVNLPDRAFDYENPDHWRVSPDSPDIPYRFASPAARQV